MAFFDPHDDFPVQTGDQRLPRTLCLAGGRGSTGRWTGGRGRRVACADHPRAEPRRAQTRGEMGYFDGYSLRGPLASLNGISVNLAELFLKFQGLFLNVSRTIPNCVHI